MKLLILTALCAIQLTLPSAVQARAGDNTFETQDRSPWRCLFAVAGSEQTQSETDESEQQSEEEEEPDCD